jgi:hypothetical protein
MDQGRRGFLTKVPLAVAGAALSANEIARGHGALMDRHTNAGFGGVTKGCDPSPCNPGVPPAPNMPREAAFKLLSKSATIRKEIRMRLVEDSKFAISPSNIDPDIAILRSLSPMAKLTLARQRYVENGIEAALKDRTFSGMHGRLHDFLSEKAHELMWSEKSIIQTILGDPFS